MQESYFKARANAPIVVEGDEDVEMDYDSDGYPVISEKSRVIDPLPPVDHAAVSLGEEFEERGGGRRGRRCCFCCCCCFRLIMHLLVKISTKSMKKSQN